jgi:hypothetical protein
MLVQPREGRLGELVVDRLHVLGCQRAGVLDALPADLAIRRIDRRVVRIGGPGVQHAARSTPLPELRVLRAAGVLRLRLGVEVMEVAEELVEDVHGRQVLVAVAQGILAELPGRVAETLQEFGDARILRPEPSLNRTAR